MKSAIYYIGYLGCIVVLALSTTINAESTQQLSAIRVVRQLDGQQVTTYYSPVFAKVRIERKNQVTIIDFNSGEVAEFSPDTKGKQQLVRKKKIAELREAEERIRRDTYQHAGFAIPPLESATTFNWQLLPLPAAVDSGRSISPAECQELHITNQYGDKRVMCVRQHTDVKRLQFLHRQLANLPTSLRKQLEESTELFFYSQGFLPVAGQRYGRDFRLQKIDQQLVSVALFKVPDAKPQRYNFDQPDGYFQALQTAKRKKQE